MAGTRQPIELVVAKGKKHLTQAETARRREREVKAPAPKSAAPPKWLPEALRKEFRAIGKQLIALGIYSKLDADALGAYLVARTQWVAATAQVQTALQQRNSEATAAWGVIQERAFRQARSCASDLGLTVSSRCRLVLPEGTRQPEANPFEKLMEERRRRA